MDEDRRPSLSQLSERRSSLKTEDFLTNWTSEPFRERCVAKLESERSKIHPNANSEDQVEKFLAGKDSKQLEEFIFSKCTSKEEYMSLLAEMMITMRQHSGTPVVNTDVFQTATPDEICANGVSTDEQKST